MKGRAPLLVYLSLTVAAGVFTTTAAAASDRFVPADPDFLVADVTRSSPDEELRRRVAAWQADPAGEAAAALGLSLAAAKSRLHRVRHRPGIRPHLPPTLTSEGSHP